MMKLLATALSASLVLLATGLPLAAAAGNKAASSGMQVSFVVKEACTVQTAASPARVPGRATTAAAPVVACELNTPYLLTRGADRPAAAINGGNAAIDRPAAPIRTESGAQSWVVYF